MSPSRKVPRYAHSDGHTGICYSADGKNLVTCGSEGDIRIWHGFEDDDPTEKCVGEKAFAVAQVDDKLYVGTDHNNVQAFSFPDAELDRICTRFTAPVTCISIVKDWLVAGSSDMKVHAFNLSSGAEKVISSHNGPILEVALDPRLEYLATSCCDGIVRIFNMESVVNSSESAPIQSWTEFIPKSNDFETSPVLCRLAWSPEQGQGRWLAIPHKGKVHLYERDTWEKAFTLNLDDSEFQVVRFSPCGLYLAAGGSQGDIIVWRLQDKALIYSGSGDTKRRICSLEWHPSNSTEIAYCDQEGQLGLVEHLLDPASPPQHMNGHADYHSNGLQLDEIGEATMIDDMEEGYDMDGDEDNVISLDKIKSQSGFPVEGEEGVMQPGSRSPSIQDEGRESAMSGGFPAGPTVPATELQPAFQPTSTPTHFQYRFMVYNDVGMVRHTNTEEENSIDIEFHDSSVHHSFRINNIAGHSLAALSNKALVLASEKEEDKPSKLSCIVLNSWDGSKEWCLEFPDEDILAVAAGGSFIACISDRRLLRVFSIGGLQREVISLPGPVVCLNAKDDVLLAVYHTGQGVPEDQNLSYCLYHIGALHRSRGPHPLPLSSGSTLRWAGFSEEGSLLSYDSECVLRLCQQFGTGSTVWRPVCFMDDLTKGKSDHYFVVGISEASHSVRCILCKGCFYPPTVPRPILTQVSWRIPLLELNAEKSQLEEQFWRKQLALSSVSSYKTEELATLTKEVIAPAVKLFALSCKTDQDLRAIELCELFSNPQFLQLAVRYATSTGKTSLAEKVTEVKSGPTIINQEQEMRDSPDLPSYQSLGDAAGNSHHSQNETMDMFGEDSYQPSPDSSNIILAMKQKQVIIKPQNVVLGRVNPFKRNNSNVVEEKVKTDVIAEMTRVKSQQKPVASSLVETKASEKSASSKDTTAVKSSKPAAGIKFTEWFAKEKESLEQEFPELDKPALNKMAMKRFKETVGKTGPTPAPPAPQHSSVRSFFKPTAPSSDSQQSNVTNSQSMEDSQNTQDATMIPSSQQQDEESVVNNENNENSKKRKLDKIESKEVQTNPKKPLHSIFFCWCRFVTPCRFRI
uniref:WD repeat and HMG-box DNA-binding protein 1 n=1 Tax=Cacopsylla melanoneura TaxID=428564 RepID=A0A8D8RZF4_9HEMI